MDRVVELIVRIVALVAGWAEVFPGLAAEHYVPGQKLKVLLAGYNGARNTGSDVRVSALADQILDTLGADKVELSVISLDPASTAPYFEGKAHQIPLSTIFFSQLMRACSDNHVIVLCEGSTFKSKFSDALTLYSCEAAGVARAQGKPCIAYGGEIGAMQPYLARAVRRLCSDVLFMARSKPSYVEAQALGFESRLGTDTAWTFDSSRGRDEAMRLLREGGWDGEAPLLGVAPVNPFWWPVKPSLAKWLAVMLGDDRFLQFQKWYFFSWSKGREKMFQHYLDEVAGAVLTCARERGFAPVVIGMEKLDEDACLRFAQRLGGKVPVVLSKHHDGFAIGEILRSCSLLVTSRYHAQVIATESNVPTVAVSMDERLDNLREELGMPPELLLHVGEEDLGPRVLLALDYALEHRGEIEALLSQNRRQLEGVLGDMSQWFVEYLAGYGIEEFAAS